LLNYNIMFTKLMARQAVFAKSLTLYQQGLPLRAFSSLSGLDTALAKDPSHQNWGQVLKGVKGEDLADPKAVGKVL
jgi:hypothetical protein